MLVSHFFEFCSKVRCAKNEIVNGRLLRGLAILRRFISLYKWCRALNLMCASAVAANLTRNNNCVLLISGDRNFLQAWS